MATLVKVEIGRTSGPCTDEEVQSYFRPEEVDLIKDVVAMVNKATGDKEGWYVRVENGPSIVPSVR